MDVFKASFEHLEEVSKLFDKYRVFYNQPSNLEAARLFLQNRFQNRESVVWVAGKGDRMVGFTQLYPSFSSVSMKPIWILNDLFVDENYRKQGIARALMRAAENFARETGAVRIVLSTQVSNLAARSLYESLGYGQNEEFYHYSFKL